MRTNRRTLHLAGWLAVLALLLVAGGSWRDAEAKGWGERIRNAGQRARQSISRARSRSSGSSSSSRSRSSSSRSGPSLSERMRSGLQKAKEAVQSRSRSNSSSPSRSSPQPSSSQRAREAAERMRAAAARAKRELGRATPGMRAKAERAWRDTSSRARPLVSRSREALASRGRSLGVALRGKVAESVRTMDSRRFESLVQETRRHFRGAGPRTKAQLASLYAAGRDHLIPQARRLVERCGPAIARTIRDPRTRDRAVAGLMVAVDIHDRLHRFKDEAVAKSLDVVGNRIPIRYEGRTMTLNQWAGKYIAKTCPYLHGTTVAEEPVQALTYTLVMHDTSYMLGELRILKDERNQAVSVAEALASASGADPERLVAALEVAGSASALRTSLVEGRGTLGAAMDLNASVRTYGALDR